MHMDTQKCDGFHAIHNNININISLNLHNIDFDKNIDNKL